MVLRSILIQTSRLPVLLHQPESNECTWPGAPPSHIVVLFSAQSGRVRYLILCLTTCIADYVHNFYMFAEMDNKEYTEMQLKFQG
jgi:hypothetical protein